jgi:hypothetical protein
MISDKIAPNIWSAKPSSTLAQSSARQVLHNRESSALQYAMRDRLTTLGWSEIEVLPSPRALFLSRRFSIRTSARVSLSWRVP